VGERQGVAVEVERIRGGPVAVGDPRDDADPDDEGPATIARRARGKLRC